MYLNFHLLIHAPRSAAKKQQSFGMEMLLSTYIVHLPDARGKKKAQFFPKEFPTIIDKQKGSAKPQAVCKHFRCLFRTTYEHRKTTLGKA